MTKRLAGKNMSLLLRYEGECALYGEDLKVRSQPALMPDSTTNALAGVILGSSCFLYIVGNGPNVVNGRVPYAGDGAQLFSAQKMIL